MVSPAPLAGANPPLSYAERAKKGQNTRSPQIVYQRFTSQGASQNATISAVPATPGTTTVRSAGYISPPATLKAVPPPSHPTSDVPSAIASHSPHASSQPATPPPADPLVDAKDNPDMKPAGDSVPAPSTSSVQNRTTATPTMMARPPPPSESEAVAGYRDVGFALPPPVEHSQHEQVEGESADRGRPRELSFGTIALAGAKSPSDAPGSPSTTAVGTPGSAALRLDVVEKSSYAALNRVIGDSKLNGENVNGKTFAVFSIGVAPGESGPVRLRSRTRTHSKGAVAAVSIPDVSLRETVSAPGGLEADDVTAHREAIATVIDLTDLKTTLAFGTTQQGEDVADEGLGAEPPTITTAPDIVAPSLPPAPAPPFVPMMSPYAQPFAPPIVIPGGPGGPVNGMPGAPSPSTYAHQPTSATEDDWVVRDYGFGFGYGGPQPGYPQRDDRPFRDRRDFPPPGDNYGRPRRGSYGQGFDRGSYGGRRGKGLSGGYGGRGYSNRTFSGGRGGYANQGQPRQQPYVLQPPPPQPDLNGYYPPPMATYIPSPYESYPYAAFPPPPPPPQMVSSTAPLPIPLSPLLFPLDSTWYYLLGQLEYYLSAQNMEQDFFLRQQMDSRGWIPIGLIASFNRVRRLTTESQLVTDVLTLSSLVEVRDGYVRMHQWQQYVLPTARKSTVEDDGVYSASTANTFAAPQGTESYPGAEGEPTATTQNHEGEEDEDEDVEFVL